MKQDQKQPFQFSKILSKTQFLNKILIILKFQKNIYLTSLNYDTGLKSISGDKNTISEALKKEDINNIDNNNLIDNDRGYYKAKAVLLMQNFENKFSSTEKALKNIRGYL